MSCTDILLNTPPEKVAYIDVETTGLTAEDEILELAIVDGMGRIVYLQKFNPLRRKEWPEAAEVNGICPEDVEGLPHIAGCVHYISRIFWKFEAIIGFNVSFDLGFLERAGVDYSHVKQIGDLQADIIEEMHNRPSLVQTCEELGFHHARAHTAAADALATGVCANLWRLNQMYPGKTRAIGTDELQDALNELGGFF